MLILDRKQGQTIVIGDRTITITVIHIGFDRVRLGFEAHTDIPIHRQEVWERYCAPWTKEQSE